MKITVEIIPHEEQRYDTCGDWQWDKSDNSLRIRVSDTGSKISNCLVIIHELVEALVCDIDGVSKRAVDAFDMIWLEEGEPGDHIEAPYRNQHNLATSVERSVCAFLRYPWKTHEALVNALGEVK